MRASDDCRPIADATLDIWQANARGLYSNLFGLEKPSKPGAFNLRGRLQSDREGRNRFESVVPGRYPLFWPLTRPRHIHVFVTHPDYEPLVTQIYFEGDKYNHSDPWWHASLTLGSMDVWMPNPAGRCIAAPSTSHCNRAADAKAS